MRLSIIPTIAALMLLVSCSTNVFDPNAGAETLMLRTLDHSDSFEIEYLRSPEEGPLVLEKNALDLFWVIPLDKPDLGIWLLENLPPEAEAANVRASIRTPWYGHLLFFPTLGLVNLERIRYEADPVRYIPVEPQITESTP